MSKEVDSAEETQQVWFKYCTRKTLMDMKDMRDSGMSYTKIGKRAGYHRDAVRKFLRAYENYGIDVFVKD